MHYYNVSIPSEIGYVIKNHYYTTDYTSRMHWHGYIEIEYVAFGEAIYQFGDKEYALSQGDLWLLSVYDSHQVTCKKGLHIINIAIAPDLLNSKLISYLSEYHPLHCHLDNLASDDFMGKCKKLFYEQTSADAFSRLKAGSIINDILIDIVRNAATDNASSSLGTIQEVFAWIQLHIHEDISLAQVAEKFSLTPNYLGTLFKKSTGTSFNNYVNSLRINYACHLLHTTDLSIKNVATESGYRSVEYFNYIFKKYCNITPSRYRSGVAEQEQEQ